MVRQWVNQLLLFSPRATFPNSFNVPPGWWCLHSWPIRPLAQPRLKLGGLGQSSRYTQLAPEPAREAGGGSLVFLPTWHQFHVLFLMVSWEKQLTCMAGAHDTLLRCPPLSWRARRAGKGLGPAQPRFHQHWELLPLLDPGADLAALHPESELLLFPFMLGPPTGIRYLPFWFLLLALPEVQLLFLH